LNTAADRVIVSVRRSQFKLPSKKNVPVIMVGPGTGLAPFRGFLQERAAANAAGGGGAGGSNKMRLYFGCRRRDTDFIYGDELEKYAADGLVDLRIAFSREGQEKVYVQHLMAEDGKLLADLILREGAAVYVCGDASNMAKDVDAALRDCLCKYGDKLETEAKDYLQQMADNGRYAQDVC
jgi:sulfite reductase alpha subunit-like flavoprotein